LAELGDLVLQDSLNGGRQLGQPWVQSGSDLAGTAFDIGMCAARHTTKG
jgi:hypothetical protein